MIDLLKQSTYLLFPSLTWAATISCWTVCGKDAYSRFNNCTVDESSNGLEDYVYFSKLICKSAFFICLIEFWFFYGTFVVLEGYEPRYRLCTFFIEMQMALALIVTLFCFFRVKEWALAYEDEDEAGKKEVHEAKEAGNS